MYKADEYGNINLMDNVKAGYSLMGEAQGLIQGGFSLDKLGAARHLLAGASDFFRGLRHQFSDEEDEEGLAEADDYGEYWEQERKSVFMFSGCKDEQTSADAFIAGKHVGTYLEFPLFISNNPRCDVLGIPRDYEARCWLGYALRGGRHLFHVGESLLKNMQILQRTRDLLQQRYSQVPQLSCGYQFNLNAPMRI